MSQDTPSDAGHPAVEQSAFNTAATKAGAAFAGEYHQAPLADRKLATVADSGTLGLPKFETIDFTFPALPTASTGHQDLAGRIVKTLGGNEGALTHITKNDNGHGISVGIRQWNQEVGELPKLLKAMHDKDAQKFNATFGQYARNMQREDWVRHADIAGNPDLMKRMSKALHDPEFQQVQIDLARQFAQKSVETARHYGLRTEQGAALVADITNQLGEGGARRVFRRAGLHPGHEVKDEKTALLRMEHVTYRPNSRDRFKAVAMAFNDGALINHQPTSAGSDLI